MENLMWLLRAFLLSLTVTLVLPWGAYVGARHLPVATSPDTVTAIVAADADHAERVAALHRCRGPVLPGTPCNHDLAPAISVAELQAHAHPVLPRPVLAFVAAGRETEPPLGPPRFA